MKLELCPFCNGEADGDQCRGFINYKGNSANAVAVYCTNCEAEISMCYEDFPEYLPEHLMEMVVERWNKRDHLRTQLESKDKLIKDFCHTENEVEKSALKVLTEFQVHGDSYGVPGTNQIVDTLVSEVQSLRTRLAEVESKLHLQETTQDPQPTIADFYQSQKDVIELGKRLAEKEAEAAVMCQRLEASIKCGKSALLKLNEAENLLRETVTPPGNISQVKIPPLWISRRDTFLNPTNKDL